MSALRIGSLCSGAGMFDEGVRSVIGGELAWHAEWEPPTEKNPHPRQSALRVLAHRYPGVENLGDLTTVNWHGVEPIDVLTAGYPCQPDSAAGKRLSEDDHRWIFPAVARAIGVLRPRLVVLENVQGHFVRGFRTVLGTLADLGFDADWTLVRASDVGAPHRRERLFVVAWPAGDPDCAARGERWLATPGEAEGRWARADARRSGGVRVVADSGRGEGGSGHDADVLGRRENEAEQARVGAEPATDTDRDALRIESVGEFGGGGTAVAGHAGATAAANSGGDGLDWYPELDGAPLRVVEGEHRGHVDGRADGTDWGAYTGAIRRWERVLGRRAPAPTELATRGGQRLSPRFVEWMMGWPAGWVTNVPGISRNDALRICGNGVVPQQAAEALRRLLSLECAA